MFASVDSSLLLALRKLPVEDLLLPVLVQLIVIVAAARLGGAVARRFRQPAVVGEILAGLALGPSLFGALFPQLSASIFRPSLPGIPDELTNAAFPGIFVALKELGLIFLLFLIGIEFDFGHLKMKGKSAVAVTTAGTLFPFALGFALAFVVHPHLEPHPDHENAVPLMPMALFLGTALAITALPTLGRLMIEMGIHRTKLAAVCITAAAIGDALGWILLATVAAFAQAQFSWGMTLQMVGLTIAFVAVMLFLVRPILVAYFQKSLGANGGQLSLNSLAVLLIVLLLAAIATNLIGIFAIFGAFILGAILSDQEELRNAVNARMRDFITAFFLPIFFTYTGLRTELGVLTGTTLWLLCGAVFAAALAGKILGCGIAARATGFSWRDAGLIGAMMNTRALMELIVINVGYDLKVIPKSLFCMLVLMAVLTTVMTAPLLVLLRRGTELEKPMEDSGFLR